jgi:hypothetical protein
VRNRDSPSSRLALCALLDHEHGYWRLDLPVLLLLLLLQKSFYSKLESLTKSFCETTADIPMITKRRS